MATNGTRVRDDLSQPLAHEALGSNKTESTQTGSTVARGSLADSEMPHVRMAEGEGDQPDGGPGDMRTMTERAFSEMTVNGIRHSTLTLTSTALGGGVLSVSYVMHLCGLGLGSCMLITGGTLSIMSIIALMQMSVETGHGTYAALFSHCAGPRAGPTLDAMLFFYGNGACVGYFVFLSDFLPALVHLVAPHAADWISSRELAIFVSALAVLPLALAKSVNALRLISPISILSLIYMTLTVTVKSVNLYQTNHGKDPYGDITGFNFDTHFFEAFALCVFAFNCHLNVVPVAGSLVRPTTGRISKISWRVNLLQMCFYLLIGVTGYLSFLAVTPQDILKCYSSTDGFVAVGRIGLTGTMVVAIPMNLHPTIASGLQFADYFRESPLAGGKREAVRMITTLICVACQALLAVVVPGVADVLGILGATVATAMMLAIPAYLMGVVMPKTPSRIAQQVLLTAFALVSVASVPIKVLRWTGVMDNSSGGSC